MQVITMRRGGNIVELSHRGGPIPKDCADRFKRELQYSHVHQLRGQDAYDEVGNYTPTRIEHKLLYYIDPGTGRFAAGIGWQYRFERELAEMGYRVEVADLDPPHPRPDRYAVDWGRVFERMDLRARQDEILASLDLRSHGLLDLPPGVGKTFLVGAYALGHPNMRLHVVTEGVDIVKRIHGHLTKYLPNVGQVGGGLRRFGDRVTVISADSLHVIGEGFDDPNSKKSADAVIFDEVHKAAAPTTLEQIRKYQRCRMYGLSANVTGRADKAHVQLEGLFGEVVYRMTYQEAQALKLVAPVQVEWVDMDFDPPPDLQHMTGVKFDRHGLWGYEERNRRFSERMARFPEDVQCLVMVATVEHAVRLKQLLPDYKLCYDQCKDYAGYVASGLLDPAVEPVMTPRIRDRMRTDFSEGRLKKVIATDVWSTGVDFPELSVLGRADGRASEIMDTQIPGRANRVFDGKEVATVIDCLDTFSDKLLHRSLTRKRNYVKKGWAQLGLEVQRPGVKLARRQRVS